MICIRQNYVREIDTHICTDTVKHLVEMVTHSGPHFCADPRLMYNKIVKACRSSFRILQMTTSRGMFKIRFIEHHYK